MRRIYLATIAALIFVSCTPDDGFCQSKTYYSPENNSDFTCQQIEGIWDVNSFEMTKSYKGHTLDFIQAEKINDKTLAGSATTIIDRPAGIPDTIEIGDLEECGVGSAANGEACNEWLSLKFRAAGANHVAISSRKSGDYSNSRMKLKYIWVSFAQREISGDIDGSEIALDDTIEIDKKVSDVTYHYHLR